MHVLYFTPSEGRNAALDDVIQNMDVTLTTVTSTSEFIDGLENETWELVIAADVSLCDTTAECDAVDDYILEGNSILTLTTPGPEEEGVSEVTVIEPEVEFDITTGEPTILGIHATFIPISAGLLHDIACVIEWLDCRIWCSLHTPALTQDRRDCDQGCNNALADCSAQ